MSSGHLDQQGSSASASTPPRRTGDGALVATTTDGADEPSTKDGAHTDSNESGVVIESEDDDHFGPHRVRIVTQVHSAEQGERERDEGSRRRLGREDGYIVAYTYNDYCDEQSFTDLKDNVVFSDCIVLADNFFSSYGTCTSFCSAQGLTCNASFAVTEYFSPDCKASCDYDFDEDYEFCGDTSYGATDLYDDDCDYYNDYSCGWYDDDDFTANDMCCTCGGGDSSLYSHTSYEVACYCNGDRSVQNPDYCDEDMWDDVLNYVVCDDCKVLADMNSYSTCTDFCLAQGLPCANGYAADGDSCDVDDTDDGSGCDFDFGTSSDSAICECTPATPAPTPTGDFRRLSTRYTQHTSFSQHDYDGRRLSTSPAPTACTDTEGSATDMMQQDCSNDMYTWYGDYMCGVYDDDDFSANDMCCACATATTYTTDMDSMYSMAYDFPTCPTPATPVPTVSPVPTPDTWPPTMSQKPSLEPTLTPTRSPRVQVDMGLSGITCDDFDADVLDAAMDTVMPEADFFDAECATRSSGGVTATFEASMTRSDLFSAVVDDAATLFSYILETLQAAVTDGTLTAAIVSESGRRRRLSPARRGGRALSMADASVDSVSVSTHSPTLAPTPEPSPNPTTLSPTDYEDWAFLTLDDSAACQVWPPPTQVPQDRKEVWCGMETQDTMPPTVSPVPSQTPTPGPTLTPTPPPTQTPSLAPSPRPTTAAPSATPTPAPTATPTPAPTAVPMPAPTPSPSISSRPTAQGFVASSTPTAMPVPAPTAMPMPAPTPAPTTLPIPAPTALPTPAPTTLPTAMPSSVPSTTPTPAPTPVPTPAPTALIELISTINKDTYTTDQDGQQIVTKAAGSTAEFEVVLINVEKDTTVTMYSAGVTLVSEGLIVGQVDTYVTVYEDKAKTREKTNPGLIGDGDLMFIYFDVGTTSNNPDYQMTAGTYDVTLDVNVTVKSNLDVLLDDGYDVANFSQIGHIACPTFTSSGDVTEPEYGPDGCEFERQYQLSYDAQLTVQSASMASESQAVANEPPRLDGDYWGKNGESVRFYPRDGDKLGVPSDSDMTSITFELAGEEKSSRRRRRRMTTATAGAERERRLAGTTETTIGCTKVDCTSWVAIDADVVGCGLPGTSTAKQICGVETEADFEAIIGDEPFYSFCCKMPQAGGTTLAGTWTPLVTFQYSDDTTTQLIAASDGAYDDEWDGVEYVDTFDAAQSVTCGEGYYQDSLKYSPEEGKFTTECEPCYPSSEFPADAMGKTPSFDSCPPGTTRPTMHLQNGFWRAKTHETNDGGLGSVIVRACYGLPYPYNKACPLARGNMTGNLRCKEGHTGPLCATCIWHDPDGNTWKTSPGEQLWVMNVETFTCEECVPAKRQRAIVLVIGVFVLGFGGAIVALLFAKQLAEYMMQTDENGESNLQIFQAFKNRAQDFLDNNKDYFKVILNFFQIITNHLGGAINIDWPSGYTRIMAKLNFVNFNVAGMISQGCLFKPASYWGSLMGMTLGPIALSFLLLLYATFIAIKAKATGMDPSIVVETRNSCLSAFFALTYLVFPGTSLAVFRGFACDGGEGLFDYDPVYTEAKWATASVELTAGDLVTTVNHTYWVKSKTVDPYDPKSGTQGYGSYLQYDYGVDCNGALYQEFWWFYCILMVFIYPIGIPLMYVVSVYLHRADVNPDPVYLCAEVLLDGDDGFKSKINTTEEGVPFEVRRLAITLSGLYADVQRMTEKAETMHAEAVARTTARALDREALDARDSARRTSATAKATAKARSSFYKLKDKVQVPDAWEDFLPAYAAIIHNYENSIEIMEQDLISKYRQHNDKAAMFKFLCDAYEPQYYYWESIECLRRLALTGLLVFIAPPMVAPDYVDNAQIIVAGVICLASLQLYVRCAPYMDDAVDSISTIAQLMTFTQLFGALLISVQVDNVDYDEECDPEFEPAGCASATTSLIETLIPGMFATGLLVGTAVLVPFWDTFNNLLNTGGGVVYIIVGTMAFQLYGKVLEKKQEEADAESAERQRQREGAIEALEQSHAENDDEDAEYDYRFAKLEAVQIYTDKDVTSKCVIKDPAEKDQVKKWLGLHVQRLIKGQQDGELDDDFLVPAATAHKTAEQLRREAMVCVTPANVEALLLPAKPHNREPLDAGEGDEEEKTSDPYARTSEFQGENPLKKTSIEI